MNFDASISDNDKKQILDTIAKIDIKCLTDIRNIGNEINLLNAQIKSFQNKYNTITIDTTISNIQKSQQKNILLTNFLNDTNVYNNIRKISSTIIKLDLNQLMCIAGSSIQDTICDFNTDNIEIKNFMNGIIKYKSIIRDLLKWFIALINERQTYCGYNAINDNDIRKLYRDVVSIPDPYYNYYLYLYAFIGLGVGLLIGILSMYYYQKRKKS